MIFNILSWLTSKEVIDTMLQVLLLLATCGLIVVGTFQARAAREQATAAREQIKASEAQQKELLSQGIAARRPFFVVIDPGANQAALKNVGVGIAFKTEWRFINQEIFRDVVVPENMGAIGVGDAKPMTFNVPGGRAGVSLQHLNSQGGIRVGMKTLAGSATSALSQEHPKGIPRLRTLAKSRKGFKGVTGFTQGLRSI